MSATLRRQPARPLRPRRLTVLYDASCPACRRAKRWVERHRQLVPIEFVAAGSPAATARFPRLDVGSTMVDVTVVTDDGAVLRGDRAWIAVLWAVAATRSLSIDVAHGRRVRLFRRVKGATEAIRRLSARQPDPGRPSPAAWPPPGSDDVCMNCRT